jgi:FkbM family methyltransferase
MMELRRFIPERVKGLIVLQGLKMGRLLRKVGIRQIKRDGVTVDVTSELITDHCVGALFWRVYEWGERRAIRRCLLAGYPVIEFGASIGFIACLAARRTPNQKQVALEANLQLLPLLRENIRRNRYSDKIEVIWAAVDYSGAAEVQLDLGSGSSLVASVANGISSSTSASARIPATTLGQILRERQIEKYVLICDIEGAEVGLLQEAPLIIAGCQQIIIEFHKTLAPTGTHFAPIEIGEALASAWGMRVSCRYGDVWVLQR